MSTGMHDLTIERVSHRDLSFSGYVTLEGAPPAIFDALRLPRTEASESLQVTLYGKFSIEFDDGWPVGITIERCFLNRSYRTQSGTDSEIEIEVVPYDVIERAGDPLTEYVWARLDLDSAAQSHIEDQIDSAMRDRED